MCLVAVGLLVAGCGGTRQSAKPEQDAARPPTPGERARIVFAVTDTWTYESEPLYRYVTHHFRPRRPRLRPKVVRILVSRSDPRFSSAVIELRDALGRQRGPAAVMVFTRIDHDEWAAKNVGAWVVAGPGTTFPNACSTATPRGMRTLLCPDPWRVLGYPRPRVRGQTEYTQRVPSPDLHTIDWRTVALPGGVCGSSRPIRPRHGPEAFIHADVNLLWWNPVVVSSWSRPTFGDLDGDGRDEAALNVVCANGGGPPLASSRSRT